MNLVSWSMYQTWKILDLKEESIKSYLNGVNTILEEFD